MKSLALFVFLLYLPVSYVLGQQFVRPEEASNYLGKKVIVAGKITSIEVPDSFHTTRCRIETDSSANGLLILIPVSAVSRSKTISYIAVGQVIGVRGTVRYNKEPFLEVDSILKLQSKIKIVSVVLTPPPPDRSHHWGERVAAVDINEMSKHVGDTVKVVDGIFGYKMLGNMAIFDLGAAHPNQKLTVVLKGLARDFMEAFIVQQGNGQTGMDYLKGKKLKAIGAVSLYNGTPQIVITDPTQFMLDPW